VSCGILSCGIFCLQLLFELPGYNLRGFSDVAQAAVAALLFRLQQITPLGGALFY
jgi:hypothetical protein